MGSSLEQTALALGLRIWHLLGEGGGQLSSGKGRRGGLRRMEQVEKVRGTIGCLRACRERARAERRRSIVGMVWAIGV